MSAVIADSEAHFRVVLRSEQLPTALRWTAGELGWRIPVQRLSMVHVCAGVSEGLRCAWDSNRCLGVLVLIITGLSSQQTSYLLLNACRAVSSLLW